MYFQANCLSPAQAGKKGEMVTGPVVSVHSAFPNVSLPMMGDRGGGGVQIHGMNRGAGDRAKDPSSPAPASRVPQPGGPGGEPRWDGAQPVLPTQHGPSEPHL